MEGAPRTTTALARLLKVLGDPTRMMILDALMQGVQCNCNLGQQLGLPENLISHHVRALREAGLVQSERDPLDARWVYYSVDAEGLEELRASIMTFLDPARIQARLPTCGPHFVSDPAKAVGEGECS